MSLKGIAADTLLIVDRGAYQPASGQRVEIGPAVRAAIEGTRLYRPDEVQALLASPARLAAGGPAPDRPAPRLEVTGETTAAAGRRLAREGEQGVLLLNFASARQPGGGFLGGARAQEEDLARCSALYSCLITCRPYYDENRAGSSLLYTDHLIYSPAVPFFRDDRLELLEQAVPLSVITSPAPNAGQVRERQPEAVAELGPTLERRAGQILAVAEAHGHRVLVLGAWGCGVFRNDPAEVAAVLERWLRSERFRGAFDRVVFAVYDRAPGAPNRAAFERVFQPSTSLPLR